MCHSQKVSLPIRTLIMIHSMTPPMQKKTGRNRYVPRRRLPGTRLRKYFSVWLWRSILAKGTCYTWVNRSNSTCELVRGQNSVDLLFVLRVCCEGRTWRGALAEASGVKRMSGVSWCVRQSQWGDVLAARNSKGERTHHSQCCVQAASFKPRIKLNDYKMFDVTLK